MSRAGRFVFKLLLAGAVGGGAWFAWLSTAGSPSPLDLLPPGAVAVVEARDAAGLSRRLSGTRFAAAFAQSATREWLEGTDAVLTFDSVLAEVRAVSGVSLGRGSALQVIGADAAVGWYPRNGDGAAAASWVAGGRLSVRAWAVVAALRLGRRLGLGAAGVAREEAAGRAVYSFPGGAGESLHVFLAGRVLVGSPDRALLLQAARAAADPGAAMTREPAFGAIRGALPADGEVFAWVRDPTLLSGILPAGHAVRGSVGVRLQAGRTIEIDVVAQPASPRPAAGSGVGAAQPLPGIPLQRQEPLLLVSSREPVPAAFADLLQTRRNAVARREGGAAAAPAIRLGRGYAVVVTDSAGGPGFFPIPRGVVAIGMADSAEASRALPLLYPPGARTASAGGLQTLVTRESFPLAGEFELWGAAAGTHLFFATETALIAAATAGADTGAALDPDDASWPVDTVATLSMEKLLPLLRRWSAPLSGLLAANWPGAPDLTRDLGLLAAIGTVRVAAGSDDRHDRAAITLNVHDLR